MSTTADYRLVGADPGPSTGDQGHSAGAGPGPALSDDHGYHAGSDPGPVLVNCKGRKRRGESMRLGSLNVGTMKGKSAEVVDMLMRRKVDVCCVQETRWKGEGVRMIKANNVKYKFYYKGGKEGLGGVGVLISERIVNKVVDSKTYGDRVILVKLAFGKRIMNIISVYAPQSGHSIIEKEEFWEGLRQVVASISVDEAIWIGGDLNGHVGRTADGYEGVHGGFGYGNRNLEGDLILEFCDANEMTICNTWFEKKTNNLITYESGGMCTMIDYILTRREDRKCVRNVKVIAGEECVSQHRLLVCDMELKELKEKKRVCSEKLKVWKLKDVTVKNLFQQEIVLQNEETDRSADEVWTEARDNLLKATEVTCGRVKGPPRHSETWWWNSEIQTIIDEKKIKFKAWKEAKASHAVDEGEKEKDYKEAKKHAKRAVAIAKDTERKEFAAKLDTEEGRKDVFKIAKQIAKEQEVVTGIKWLKNEHGEVLVEAKDVKERWKEYMEKLLNVENEWDGDVVADMVEGPPNRISEEEVREAINESKTGKSSGPTEVVVEMIRAAGEQGVKWMTEICNEVIRSGKVPDDWKFSFLVPVYKGKGDPMQCGNYRAIKLLEHGMKIMERVLEKRLRKQTNIDNMQCGFMPEKGTTDGIFVVRQIAEKHKAKAVKLYYAFVDLEKAFDRVPREVVRWALRKLGVEEWLVRSVMAMYTEAMTAVKTQDGPSDKFEVKVGLHQGSVLSPLLFVSVMEVITREARTGLPWELLYADDLVLIAKSEEELKAKIRKWKECLEAKGMRVNAEKTKVMISGCKERAVEKTGKWPCGVCSKGVGVNSIKCTKCQAWTHKKCSGVKGSSTSLKTPFVCKVCIAGIVDNEVDSKFKVGEDVFERVDKFCYLGDMINANGGAESASVVRARCAWQKFRELSSILTAKYVSLKLKGRVYDTCVRSAMLFGSETWAMKAEQEARFERTEMRMVRWMSEVSLREKKTSAELRARMGLKPVGEVVRGNRLRWLGHILRKDEEDWVRKCMDYEIDGKRPRGRPEKTWKDSVEKDMVARGLSRGDAMDRERWRAGVIGCKWPTLA